MAEKVKKYKITVIDIKITVIKVSVLFISQKRKCYSGKIAFQAVLVNALIFLDRTQWAQRASAFPTKPILKDLAKSLHAGWVRLLFIKSSFKIKSSSDCPYSLSFTLYVKGEWMLSNCCLLIDCLVLALLVLLNPSKCIK